MAKIKRQITYSDLTGGLNNVDTIERINSTPKKTETPELENVEFSKLGGIKSMEGNIQIGSIQDASVIGGWDYIQGNNRIMLIATSDGWIKEYRAIDDSYDFINIYKFSTPTERVSFCNMSGGVVITNGVDDLVYYHKGRRKKLSGTVDVSTVSATEVHGTGTLFESELRVGDGIQFGDDDTIYYVTEIHNDTKIDVDKDIEGTVSGSNYYLSDISLCNATLTNNGSVEPDPDYKVDVRGLAINFYAGRLWVGGKDGLYYSGVNEYWGWDIQLNDAGVLQDSYGDTSDIKALGLYSQYMMVHKEFYTYLLTCSGASDSIQVTPYSNISCDSQQSFCVSNTKYYVYSAELMDIYPLVQRSIFSDKYLGDTITSKVRNLFWNIRSAELEKIFCVTHPKKRYMVFYMPMQDTYGSSYGLIYNFQTKSFLVRRVPQNVTIAFNYNNDIYIGTRDGLVLKEFTGSTFKILNTTTGFVEDKPIKAYFKTPWFDWADGYTQSFSEFALQINKENNNDFFIKAYKDGNIRTEERRLNSNKLSGNSLVWAGIGGHGLDGYDILEYIESDGNQYIDTGVLPTSETGIELIHYITEQPEQDDYGNFTSHLLGCGYQLNQYVAFYRKLNSNYYIQGVLGQNTETIQVNNYIENIQTLKLNYLNDNKISIDGIGQHNITPQFYGETIQSNLYLFAMNDSGSAYNSTKMRLYSCIITEGYEIVRNLYPVRKLSTNELGLYDINHNVFYPNQGTGTFIAGQTLIPANVDNDSTDNNTTWDNDIWVSSDLEEIRLLLPNNVFGKFQLEIGIEELGQAFDIIGMTFRRIETDEAPW